MNLEERLKNLQQRLQHSVPPNERAVYTSVIEPVLRALGWNTDNYHEVYPEYSVGSGRVDYALRIREEDDWRPVIFIEVKQPGKLDENAEGQLFDYAAREGVPAAFLTDGITWRLYYPLTSGKPADRFVKAVNLLQNSLPQLLVFFQTFLERKNIPSVRTYEKKLREEWEERIQLLKLQEVWEELKESGDLYKLLAERLSKKLGEPISPDRVETLWRKLPPTGPAVLRDPRGEPSPSIAPPSSPESPQRHLWYKGKQLSHRKLRGLIMELFCHIAQENPGFLEGFYLSPYNGGHARKYIARSPEDLYKDSKMPQPEKHAVRLPCTREEWYLMVNFGEETARTIVEKVSRYLGLPFGQEEGLKVGW